MKKLAKYKGLIFKIIYDKFDNEKINHIEVDDHIIHRGHCDNFKEIIYNYYNEKVVDLDQEKNTILSFDLTDFDDSRNLKRCIKSEDMADALFEIGCNLKKKIEWQIEDRDDLSNDDVLDIVFDKISEIMYDRGIIIDDLIV